MDLSSIFVLTPKKCTKFLIIYCVVMNGFCSALGISSIIFYLCDIVVTLLLVCLMKRGRVVSRDPLYKYTFFAFVALFVFGCINQLINFVPLQLAIWGDRNFFRFYILFFCVLAFCEMQDIDDIMKCFFWFQILNTIYGGYKFFGLGLQEDAFGGGLFLNGAGMCPFCILVSVYYMNMYLEKRCGLTKMLIMFFSSMFLAIVAEEKFLMLTGILSIFLGFLMNRVNYRKVILGISGVGVVMVALTVLENIIPSTYEILTNISNLTEYASATFDTGYRIPRIGAFAVIEQLFMEAELVKWIGLGLGNCDTSSISFFESAFYQQYGQYNYRWFTHQWTYLEMGRIGFFLYLLFFVTILILLVRNVKKTNGNARVVASTSIIFTIIMIMFCWQGTATRTDTGYYVFFGMAMGLVAIHDTDRGLK